MIDKGNERLLNRREFIRLLGLAGSGLVVSACAPGISNAFSEPGFDQRLNILLIVTDDQRWDTLERMPVLQSELVGKGAQFTQAFATTPLCSPSRASILTGRYAHNHTVTTNGPPEGDPFTLDETSTIAYLLQEAGYKTALIGKYIHDDDQKRIPIGWDEWICFSDKQIKYRYYYDYELNENGTLVRYGVTEQDYSTDVLLNKAKQFINELDDQPFFLHLGFATPHEPRTPAPRHEGKLDNLAPWRPPSFNERLIEDKPQWIQELELLDPDRMDRAQQDSLEGLLAVDEAIGELINALKRKGVLDKTVIIFTSDQGVTWGEHRLPSAKSIPYEEGIRLPLIIRIPGMTDVGPTIPYLALNIDLAPTIAELAGLTTENIEMDGYSLLPVLTQENPSWRDQIFIEHWRTGRGQGDKVPDFVAVRDYRWKFVQYETGERELYHLIDDPYENFNLINEPAYVDTVTDLENKVIEFQKLRTSADSQS